MTKEITYSIYQKYFDAILEGKKTFEIRKISSDLISATHLKLYLEGRGMSLSKSKRYLVCEIGFILPLGEAEGLFGDDEFADVAEYAIISLINPKEIVEETI